jgi:hypothetical protein
MDDNSQKIEGTVEAWEEGLLGTNENSAQVSDLILQSDIDEAMSLSPISIRLQKSLIDDLKIIAERNNMGYQPLIKNVLHRFVAAEMRQYFREHAGANIKAPEDDQQPQEPKRAAG